MSSLERRVFELEAKLQEVRQLIQRVPLRELPPPPGPLRVQVLYGTDFSNSGPPYTENLRIVYVPTGSMLPTSQNANGQVATSIEAADRVYDPSVDMQYIAGLGCGYLQVGSRTTLVLIRHSWLGFTDAIVQGALVLVGAPVPLPVVNSDAVLLAYPIIGV